MKTIRHLTVLALLVSSTFLNGCKKKSEPQAMMPPLPPAAAAPAETAGDISKNGAVLVFPRPLTGPITIDFSRK